MVAHSGFLHTDRSLLSADVIQVVIQYVLPLKDDLKLFSSGVDLFFHHWTLL